MGHDIRFCSGLENLCDLDTLGQSEFYTSVLDLMDIQVNESMVKKNRMTR